MATQIDQTHYGEIIVYDLGGLDDKLFLLPSVDDVVSMVSACSCLSAKYLQVMVWYSN